MVKKARKESRPTEETFKDGDAVKRTSRRTYAITQRGIHNSNDLFDFHTAALADIDAGRSDPKEMTLMVAITGQMLVHENLKYKVGLHRNASSGAHHFFPTVKVEAKSLKQ